MILNVAFAFSTAAEVWGFISTETCVLTATTFSGQSNPFIMYRTSGLSLLLFSLVRMSASIHDSVFIISRSAPAALDDLLLPPFVWTTLKYMARTMMSFLVIQSDAHNPRADGIIHAKKSLFLFSVPSLPNLPHQVCLGWGPTVAGQAWQGLPDCSCLCVCFPSQKKSKKMSRHYMRKKLGKVFFFLVYAL